MTRFFGIILLVAASLSAAPVYQAVYTNGSASNDGSYVIGLTQITLTGQTSATFDSMCFDFSEHINSGQQYQATVTKLTDYSSDANTQAQYDMAGFIYLAMHNLPAVTTALGNSVTGDAALLGLQYGVWDLFDTNESDDASIYRNYAYTSQVDGAVDQMLANPGELTTFTTNLKGTYAGALDNLYVVQGYGSDAGLQKFIVGGNVPASVPEPGALGLVGGGLIGIAMLIRKRAIL